MKNDFFYITTFNFSMKNISGILIITMLTISMIAGSIVAYKAEKKKCDCEPKTVFNTPLKEVFEIN